MSSVPPIACHAATVAFGGQTALADVTGEFATGSMTAVVGPNGAGKTTLLKAILGELPLVSGSIHRGVPRREIAYLPQAAEIDRRFPITVFDALVPGLWRRIGAFRSVKHDDLDRVEHALDAVGLPGTRERAIGALSVGQFQRVLFARLLLQDAPVILLDEPFAALDEQTTADLVELIEAWRRQGRTIIAVLHDLAQVRRSFPQTLLLAGRVLAWGATHDVLTPDLLARVRRRVDPFPFDVEGIAS